MNRGEWAWVTAPVISLVFAGILFQSARSLYSAQLSSATQGLLVMDQGSAQGMFVGTSQVFVPRAGGYDLKLKGVDSIGLIQIEQDYGYRYNAGSEESNLEPVDTGSQILVPSMPVNNLAFRQLTYRQRMGDPGWFQIEQERVGSEIKCRVTNRSPYALNGGSVCFGTRKIGLKDLRPGESHEVQGAYETKEPDATQVGLSVGSIAARQGAIVLTGELQGLRPGPQIGAEVPGRTSIHLAYSTPVEVSR
jgi:hypothetical protein